MHKDNKNKIIAGLIFSLILSLNISGAFAAPSTTPPNGDVTPSFTGVRANTFWANSPSTYITFNDDIRLNNEGIIFQGNNSEGATNTANIENTNGNQIRIADDIDLGEDAAAGSKRSIVWGTGISLGADTSGVVIEGDLKVNGSIVNGASASGTPTKLELTGEDLDPDPATLRAGGPIVFRTYESSKLVFGDSTRIQHRSDRITNASTGEKMPTTVFELPIVTNGKGIGAYEKRWQGYSMTVSDYPLNTPTIQTAGCPDYTQIVACNGYVSDPGPNADADFLGANISYSSNSCRSQARRTGSGSATHYVEALCFSPTGYITKVGDDPTGDVNTARWIVNGIFGTNDILYSPYSTSGAW